MTATDTVFAGSIPAIYDQYMVPLIFAPYARLVAELRALRREVAELRARETVVKIDGREVFRAAERQRTYYDRASA